MDEALRWAVEHWVALALFALAGVSIFFRVVYNR
jgi:hypothetical protein